MGIIYIYTAYLRECFNMLTLHYVLIDEDPD